jgi:hypothetical protein
MTCPPGARSMTTFALSASEQHLGSGPIGRISVLGQKQDNRREIGKICL